MNDFIYSRVIAPLVKALYTEVMVIGMFFVGFGYLRSAISDALVVRRGHFWRRILLFTLVILFSIYIILSYNVDNTNHGQVNRDATSILPPKAFFMLMAPLELVMVGLSGAMFLILGFEVFPQKGNSKDDFHLQVSQKSKLTLTFLFGISALWHFCCIIWWFFWLDHDSFSLLSVNMQAFITVVHLLSLLVWRRLASSKRYSSQQGIYDWIGVVWYFLIIFTVYILRMCWYAESIMLVK